MNPRILAVLMAVTGLETIRSIADYTPDLKPVYRDGYRTGADFFSMANSAGQDVHVPFARVRSELRGDGFTLDGRGELVELPDGGDVEAGPAVAGNPAIAAQLAAFGLALDANGNVVKGEGQGRKASKGQARADGEKS